MTELSDFISAGYYLTQPVVLDWIDEDIQKLMPEKVISLSSCISPCIPDTGWRHERDKFGLAEDVLDEMNVYFKEAFIQGKVDYPSTWYTLHEVHNFLAKFGQYLPDVMILGRGIHPDILPELQQEAHEHRTTMQKSNYGTHGIFEAILENQPIEGTGAKLGYEVVGINLGLEHSMYCYQLIGDFAKQFNAKLNQYGFYDDFSLAKQYGIKASAFYENGDSVGDCYWCPLLVVQYER